VYFLPRFFFSAAAPVAREALPLPWDKTEKENALKKTASVNRRWRTDGAAAWRRRRRPLSRAREKEKKNILAWPQPRRRLRWAFSSD
jgi:hypothetical protein